MSPEALFALHFYATPALGEREPHADVQFVRAGLHLIGETTREGRFA